MNKKKKIVIDVIVGVILYFVIVGIIHACL